METYRPPLTDMLFALNALADLPSLLNLPAYASVDDELVQAVLDEAANFFANELAPTNQLGDVEGVSLNDGAVTVPESFVNVYQHYVEQGWAALYYDEADGGHGLPAPVTFAVVEMVQAANLSFSMCPLLAPAAVDTLQHHASAELADKFVPQLVSGEWTATMALTEPQAGSDLSLVRTKAVPDGDSYLISGQKIFISWADHNMAENIVHLVLARLPDAPEGVQGISLFVVPKFVVNADGSLGERNDVQITGIEHKLGLHASPTCSVSFGDAGGARGYLMGEPHKGLSYMFTMMNHARLQVGGQAVALSQLAYQQALAYANERRQGRAGKAPGPVALIQHADIQRMLMTIKAGTEAMRGLVYSTAADMDTAKHTDDAETKSLKNARVEWLTPIVKAWNTELVQELTALCVQIHGGMGFVEETGVAQLVRDSRILTIYEGTTGIQSMDLLRRKLLKDGGKSGSAWIEEMRQTAAQAAASSEFAAQAQYFNEALNALSVCTEQLLAWAATPAAELGRVAYDYLMMCGYTAGAWQLLRGALLAGAQHNELFGPDYQRQRVQLASFYMANLLPRTLSHQQVVLASMAGMGELDPASFAEY